MTTCHGYVLDTAPVPFTVDGSEAVVTVTKSNMAQKGVIRIQKTGEVFSSVVNEGSIFRLYMRIPDFREQSLISLLRRNIYHP